MERIKKLNVFQKAVLIVIIAMAIVFSAIYSKSIAREGYDYRSYILVPKEENGSVVYSGKLDGEPAFFRVTGSRVEFSHGSKIYGPYTVTEMDPPFLAVSGDPEDSSLTFLKCIEIRCGEELFFRGAVRDIGGGIWLYDEKGDPVTSRFIFFSDGSGIDGDGDPVDKMEPSAHDIAELVYKPELTHKGSWAIWSCGAFLCALTAVSMLFADELFRWNLSFRIRDPEKAEPSDWEMLSRYLVWTAIPVTALIIFVTGLK